MLQRTGSNYGFIKSPPSSFPSSKIFSIGFAPWERIFHLCLSVHCTIYVMQSTFYIQWGWNCALKRWTTALVEYTSCPVIYVQLRWQQLLCSILQLQKGTPWTHWTLVFLVRTFWPVDKIDLLVRTIFQLNLNRRICCQQEHQSKPKSQELPRGIFEYLVQFS